MHACGHVLVSVITAVNFYESDFFPMVACMGTVYACLHLGFPRDRLWVSFLWSKAHKRLKRTLFNWIKQEKRAKFQGSPLFQATYNRTINSLSLCQLDGGRLVETSLPTQAK